MIYIRWYIRYIYITQHVIMIYGTYVLVLNRWYLHCSASLLLIVELADYGQLYCVHFRVVSVSRQLFVACYENSIGFILIIKKIMQFTPVMIKLLNLIIHNINFIFDFHIIPAFQQKFKGFKIIALFNICILHSIYIKIITFGILFAAGWSLLKEFVESLAKGISTYLCSNEQRDNNLSFKRHWCPSITVF